MLTDNVTHLHRQPLLFEDTTLQLQQLEKNEMCVTTNKLLQQQLTEKNLKLNNHTCAREFVGLMGIRRQLHQKPSIPSTTGWPELFAIAMNQCHQKLYHLA